MLGEASGGVVRLTNHRPFLGHCDARATKLSPVRLDQFE
jgi:hypothetical protein